MAGPDPRSRLAGVAALARGASLELVALAATGAVVLLLRGRGLRMGWQAFDFTLPPMFGMLPKVLGYGVALNLAVVALRRQSVPAYLRRFLQPGSLLLWMRVTVAFMLVTFAYTWLKVCVPLLERRLWDAELWRFERWLHFGFAPNVFAVELLDGTPLAELFDRWYGLWLLTVVVAWSWAAAHADFDLRRRFALGCALLWIAGSWLYLALPALGPCYAFPELFSGVADQLPRAAGAQAMLAENYNRMIAGRDGTLRQFNPYFGVAAMPSLHVGAHWFFALWARRYARRLFPWLALATALTFVGSLVTGWHYAVDGYAGMLLAWAVFALSRRIEPEPPALDSDGAEGAAAAGEEPATSAGAPAAP